MEKRKSRKERSKKKRHRGNTVAILNRVIRVSFEKVTGKQDLKEVRE